MAMAVDRDMSRAFTVSADHLLCRYDFARILTSEATKSLTRNEVVPSCSVKQIGNASVAISSDGRIVAVGGWDGKYVTYLLVWIDD